MKSYGKYVLLGILLGITPLDMGRAASLPSYYPATFMTLGEVQVANHREFYFVINALQYRYSAALKVHTLTRENDYISRLTPGMKVGFNYSGSDGTRALTEVWELPATVKIPLL